MVRRNLTDYAHEILLQGHFLAHSIDRYTFNMYARLELKKA